MSDAQFRVFGLDRQLYGPVPTGTLQEWARDGRVLRDAWVHVETLDAWRRAETVTELDGLFPGESAKPVSGIDADPVSSTSGVPAKVLTRLKLFGDFTHEELEPFAREMLEQSFRPFSFVVQQGTMGDSMYFVIQGRVGISTKGQVADAFLVGLNIGDTFGEMSIFDPAPRSADVRAENEVIVLKLTADSVQRICRDSPAAGTKFVWNVARLLSARIRAMDRRAASAKDLDAAGRPLGRG